VVKNMKLSSIEICISSHSCQRVNDEMVIVNEINKKVILLNKVSTFIWDMIVDSYQKDQDISDHDITSVIIEKFSLTQDMYKQVLADVKEAIESLYKAGLIYESNSKQGEGDLSKAY